MVAGIVSAHLELTQWDNCYSSIHHSPEIQLKSCVFPQSARFVPNFALCFHNYNIVGQSHKFYKSGNSFENHNLEIAQSLAPVFEDCVYINQENLAVELHWHTLQTNSSGCHEHFLGISEIGQPLKLQLTHIQMCHEIWTSGESLKERPICQLAFTVRLQHFNVFLSNIVRETIFSISPWDLHEKWSHAIFLNIANLSYLIRKYWGNNIKNLDEKGTLKMLFL